MSSSGGFAVSRNHGGDRFYNPPVIRRHRQMLQQQKLLNQQIPRPVKSEVEAATAETDSDDSAATLSKPPSVSSASPPRPPTNATNLDRLVEAVTPFVPALCPSEGNARGWRIRELQPYYCLGDLWESFKEWSVYGAGVPLLLKGEDSIIQYYVPYLSGIQLRRGEESDAESSRETSSGGSSDCEADRRAKGVGDGSWSRKNLMNLNSQQMNRLSLREKSLVSSSSDEAETCTSPGTLLFEYLEQEPPHNRKPLTDKASNGQSRFHGASGRKVHGGVNAPSKISLPVFGLASYKLKGSILSPSGPHESQQENSLLQDADNWLRRLQVVLPDYQFFRSHYSQWR
ncbi:hypothetical protein Acr_28g0000780 [Actinidia rufa]|uniref:DUF789 family protein n=1 Tax=Actinidia rufa TaxID=165716 RepID=A0A7J0H8E1_9ERIC|nr:hypothetical protein Acr_28g0000780 [Actinidia rufa]